VNGKLYMVIFDHVSGLTFDANASDGIGDNYYALLLEVPGNSLPAGGATGQMLAKVTTGDYVVTWQYPLPVGGTTGQVLVKLSSTAMDVAWENFPGIAAPPPSPSGQAGDALLTNDGSSSNTIWGTSLGRPRRLTGQPVKFRLRLLVVISA